MNPQHTPTINNPAFTTTEWLDALESGDIFDIADEEYIDG